jgi:hypothetical protein
MAIAYEKYGSCSMITFKQSAAAADATALLGSIINDGNSYTVLGVWYRAIASDAASKIDVEIAGANIGTQGTPAVATPSQSYTLSTTFANLQALGGDNMAVNFTSAATQVQVHILISQFTPADI